MPASHPRGLFGIVRLLHYNQCQIHLRARFQRGLYVHVVWAETLTIQAALKPHPQSWTGAV